MVTGGRPARILYIQYVNPAALPPLEHSSRLLADAGWQVLFFGIRLDGGADNLRLPFHPGIQVRQLPPCRSRRLIKVHYVWFCLMTLAVTLWWRPTWVYASDVLACPVALLLSLVLRVQLVYHEHDSPSLGPSSVFVRLCLAARKMIGRRARLCILPNRERARLFTQAVGPHGPVLHVPNYPRRDEVAVPRRERAADALHLYYHGSIVPARLPLTVVQALNFLPAGVRLTAVGYETAGHPGYIAELRTEAARVGVHARVQLLGPMPRRDLLPYSLESDVGIALMPMSSSDLNMNEMAGASNKPFDYLACGLALLVADLSDWRAWYVEPGYGLACNPDDPLSIAHALRWFLEHPTELRTMGERGRQKILTTWNYELAFAPAVEHLLRKPASA